MDKTLRELCAPSKFTVESRIVTQTTTVEDFAINVKFICEVQDKAFLGHADEDLYMHLMNFDTLCCNFRRKKICHRNFSY